MRIWIALFLACIATPAMAQDVDTELWLTTNETLRLTRDTDLLVESIERFSDDDGGLYEWEVGGAVTRRLGKGFDLVIGHYYVPNYRRGRLLNGEQRPRQQINVRLGNFLGGAWQARLRIEERFRTDGRDTGVRLRPQIRYATPIGSSGVQLRLSHETYYNLNDTDFRQIAGYERMRNFISLTRPVRRHLQLELGYLNQYRFAQGRRSVPDRMDNVLSLGLSGDF